MSHYLFAGSPFFLGSCSGVAHTELEVCTPVAFSRKARLHRPPPTQSKHLKKGCEESELVSGAHLSEKKRGVGRPRRLLLSDSFLLTAIVQESHFISAAPWECGVSHPPPSAPVNVSVRGLLAGGRAPSHHLFSGYYLCFRRISLSCWRR